jgi:hypothetical protein
VGKRENTIGEKIFKVHFFRRRMAEEQTKITKANRKNVCEKGFLFGKSVLLIAADAGFQADRPSFDRLDKKVCFGRKAENKNDSCLI